MEYNNQSHITCLAEVVYFFEHLLYDRKLSFHPDDDFANYVSDATGEATFTPQEVIIYNRLMEESFDVCDKEGIEIYTIGLASMRKLIDPSIDDPIDVGELVRIYGDKTIYKVTSIDNDNMYELCSIDGGVTSITSSLTNLVAI